MGMIVASVAGGLIQSRSASRAASAQTQAANNDIALQRQIYEENVDRFAPYEQTGRNALNALAFELGLGARPTFGGSPADITTVPGGTQNVYGLVRNPAADPDQEPWIRQVIGTRPGQRFQVGDQTFNTREEAEAYAAANPTGGTPYAGFQATPGYGFRVSEGLGAVEAGAAARGGLYSGAAMQALQQRGNDLANQEYGNYLNRIMGVAASGQSAAGQGAAAGTNFANAAGAAYGDIGNAQAAGAIARGNALNNAIQGGIQSWQYQQMLQPAYAVKK